MKPRKFVGANSREVLKLVRDALARQCVVRVGSKHLLGRRLDQWKADVAIQKPGFDLMQIIDGQLGLGVEEFGIDRQRALEEPFRRFEATVRIFVPVTDGLQVQVIGIRIFGADAGELRCRGCTEQG
jgi:hypothetical protein